MRNEDWFEYMKNKSFKEKLKTFYDVITIIKDCSANIHYRNLSDDDYKYYASERQAQIERCDWLFEELLREYNCK